VSIQDENEYEDLLSLWSDLEAGLAIILASPGSIQEFEPRVWQYDRWMQGLLARDTDVGLYLLFQLAGHSAVGYSASHALVSAVLCHLIAGELALPPGERDSLVHAALTMNIAMTALQDQLAVQVEKPSLLQQVAIRGHAGKGGSLLDNMGIHDPLWLQTVVLHHDESTERGELRAVPPEKRLARILRVVDRYAAMISPRQSREGRTATDSLQSIVARASDQEDEIGQALIRVVGLCPPGTFVRLESKEVAVVMRRGPRPESPQLAVVLSESGQALKPPRLHDSNTGSVTIRNSLTASAVREHLNHHVILQLGTQSALAVR
jgi:hypothetical protein